MLSTVEMFLLEAVKMILELPKETSICVKINMFIFMYAVIGYQTPNMYKRLCHNRQLDMFIPMEVMSCSNGLSDTKKIQAFAPKSTFLYSWM